MKLNAIPNLRKTTNAQFLPVKFTSGKEPLTAQVQLSKMHPPALCGSLQVLFQSSSEAVTVFTCKSLTAEGGLILRIQVSKIFTHSRSRQADRDTM